MRRSGSAPGHEPRERDNLTTARGRRRWPRCDLVAAVARARDQSGGLQVVQSVVQAMPPARVWQERGPQLGRADAGRSCDDLEHAEAKMHGRSRWRIFGEHRTGPASSDRSEPARTFETHVRRVTQAGDDTCRYRPPLPRPSPMIGAREHERGVVDNSSGPGLVVHYGDVPPLDFSRGPLTVSIWPWSRSALARHPG